MSDEPLNFEEHRRRREDDPDLVRCARCRKTILATSVRCPECGIHFQGTAEDFAPDEVGRSGNKTWVVVVAVLLLIAIVLAGFGLR